MAENGMDARVDKKRHMQIVVRMWGFGKGSWGGRVVQGMGAVEECAAAACRRLRGTVYLEVDFDVEWDVEWDGWSGGTIFVEWDGEWDVEWDVEWCVGHVVGVALSGLPGVGFFMCVASRTYCWDYDRRHPAPGVSWELTHPWPLW